MILHFGATYGSKAVMMEEDIEVQGKVEGWAVRGVFKAEVRGVSKSNPRKSKGLIF